MSQPQESRAQAWARLRFSIIGPLLAAPPGRRQLAKRLEELAAQDYRHPFSGQPVRFGMSTIERWFYRARDAADPMRVLRPAARRDRGRQSAVCQAMQSLIVAQYWAHNDWSARLLYDNVTVLAQQQNVAPMPSYATVLRFLQAQGLSRRAKAGRLRPGEVLAAARKQAREVRSYEVAHVHALWHLDFHQSSQSMTTPDGRRVAPRLLCVLDDCSRLVCHAQWYWAESAQCLVHGVMQALLKRGLPRQILMDNGAAMLADETRRGLEQLSIAQETTLPYSPYQNGKQEVFWNQVEGRLLPMLGDTVGHMTLEALNEATLAWVEMEYQQALHRELGTSPAARCLAGPTVSRTCPEMLVLRQAFATQQSRVVRQSDGTVSVEGRRFEVPARLRSLHKLLVRYARWDLSHVWAVDSQTGAILSALHPLDKRANADRQRRCLDTRQPTDEEGMTAPSDIAPLMRQLMDQYALTGAPPAFLASPPPTGTEVTP